LQQQPAIGQNFFNNPTVIPQNPLNTYGTPAYPSNVPTVANGNMGITLSTNKPSETNPTLSHSGAGTA
jgi:hypothetical protein